MPVRTSEFSVSSNGYCHLHDITQKVQDALLESSLRDGIACVAVVGSTAGVSTVEFEPGLIEDIPEFFEKILPSDRPYLLGWTLSASPSQTAFSSFLDAR